MLHLTVVNIPAGPAPNAWTYLAEELWKEQRKKSKLKMVRELLLKASVSANGFAVDEIKWTEARLLLA